MSGVTRQELLAKIEECVVLGAIEDNIVQIYDDMFRFTLLYLNTFGFRWLRRNSQTIQDFDELVAETSFRAYSRINHYYLVRFNCGCNGARLEHAWSFLSWFAELARTELKRGYRETARKKRAMAIVAVPLAFDEAPPYADVVNMENSCKRARLMRQVLEKIPEKKRKVFELKYFNDDSMCEISRKCSLPVNTVKSILKRGKWDIQHNIFIMKLYGQFDEMW